MTLNHKKNIALCIAALFLFLALIDGWQYGFFTILRFIVFSATAYVAWIAYENGDEMWTWLFGATAVLFNPFIPIHFSREIWTVIDFLAGVFCLLSAYFFRLTK
jgi:MFS superfamily sulfate permease-like transporter